MSPTQRAVSCANPVFNTSSPSHTGSAQTHAFPPAPSPATCPQAAPCQRVPGMLPQCTGENGTKAIPAQCAQAGPGHWEAGLLHSLSKRRFPVPVPCRLLPVLWAGQSPTRRGYKQETQEGCDRATAVGPSKSLLEMQKRARNWIISLPQERQPERFPLTIQDTSQHQKTKAEKMQPLHFAAESGRGWAGGDGAPGRRGELCTASLHSAVGAVCYLNFQTLAFTFFWRRGAGGSNKSCHRLDFNL